MNSPSLATSSQLPSSQPELLYGNGHFLVRLWHIQPEQSVAFGHNPGAPSPAGQSSQFFLLEGSLSATGQNAPSVFPLGQRVVMPAHSPDWVLSNPGPHQAILLDLVQGDNLQRIPLPETTETRPWGSFTILKDEPHYKLKQLLNTPGNRLSLQRHQKREEHWMIIAGCAEITLDDTLVSLQPSDYIHIPLHSWHRLANPSKTAVPVEVIELQLGKYFGEDDIERCQDDYGRT